MLQEKRGGSVIEARTTALPVSTPHSARVLVANVSPTQRPPEQSEGGHIRTCDE